VTFVAGVHICCMMDEDDVIAISNYLLYGTYPESFARDDKRSLRQKSSSFVCAVGWYCICYWLCYLILSL